MPKPDIDYSLYYVTARDPTCGIDSFVDHLEGACRGGVTVVQLREKTASTRDFLNVAKAAKAVTDRFRIPLFINDRLDIALAVGCHLHVGQDDFPALQARALLGPDALIGVSVNTPDELEEVLREGTADYVGIGPIHATLSKKDHNPPIGNRGARDLLALLEDSPIQAVAIGGLNADTLPAFLAQSPAYVRKSQSYRTYDGVACVSAISAASDPQAAAMQLRQAFRSEGPRYPLPSPACARSAEEMVRAAAALLRELRSSDPKVCQNITNQVVMNDTANLTLALSSSPIMSGNPEEAVELGGLIGALVLNMGTVDARQVQGATLAGKTANRNAKPVLLDPVGVGASTFRKETIAQLMDDVHMTVIKGNAGEIGALAGLSEVQSRGVDSAGPGFKDPGTVVCDLARREKTVVAMSGETDWVSDGQVVFSISNGHRYQGDITGSGCMLSAAIACFLSVSGRDRALEATIAAILAYNIAAEVAGTRDGVRGPNTFRSALIDECYNLKPEQIEKAARLVLM